VLSLMIPPAKRGGRSRDVNVREVLNAFFLPKDLPPKSTMHNYFMLWDRAARLSVLCVVASPHTIAAAEFIDQVRRRREGPQHSVDNLAAGERQNQQSQHQIKSSICHSNPQSVVDDSGLRGSPHHGLSAEADDLGHQCQTAVRQAALRHAPTLAVHAVGPNRSPNRKLGTR
jgi:endonuclease/exonuclease/phosphatase (EEP) superfamily protein YafD